jgi:2-keto-4-pentenoate hydratase/2-oxohepta-3-ene-1,7-dioic acid hydratase in catechol pathway
MKFVSYLIDDEAHYGVLKDRSVIDLTSRLPYRNFVEFIASGDDHPIQALLESENGDYLYENLRLLPVVPEPGKILCIGLNYHDHVAEADRKLGGRETPTKPMIFARFAESLTGHREPIRRPRVSHQLDWEAELLVVIGTRVPRYSSPHCALEHVYGYSVMNEACLRDYQFHTRQLTPGKNFENTGAIGPWLVTADEVPDPQNLDIEMRLNGEVMQSGNTADMVFSVAHLIAYISEWLPLNPGDLIATGTMGGVGFARNPQIFMKPGDTAEVSISGIGTLRNGVEDEVVGA